jgi:hypothetical protein
MFVKVNYRIVLVAQMEIQTLLTEALENRGTS